MLARASYPTPAYAPPRENGAKAPLALAALTLVAVWAIYATPGPRRAALTALRPLLGGLIAPEPGLRFEGVHARRGELNGQTVLYVEGSVTNAGAARRKTPGLVVTLVGDNGRPLYAWKAKIAKPDVEAGGAAPFQARLMSPPEPYRNIAVTFAEAR